MTTKKTTKTAQKAKKPEKSPQAPSVDDDIVLGGTGLKNPLILVAIISVPIVFGLISSLMYPPEPESPAPAVQETPPIQPPSTAQQTDSYRNEFVNPKKAR